MGLPQVNMNLTPEFSSNVVRREDIYMNTATGKKFFHFAVSPENIDITDIAHALANNCRFSGHTRFHYSVAQHSCYVLDLLIKIFGEQTKQVMLTALLHDASEAYIADIHTLVKRQLPDYMALAKYLDRAVSSKFGLIFPEPAEIKLADGIMLSTELVQLVRGRPHKYKPLNHFVIPEITPRQAKEMFLDRYYEIVDSSPRLATPTD